MDLCIEDMHLSHDSVATVFKEYIYPTELQWKIHEINHKKKALQLSAKSIKSCYIILVHILDGFSFSIFRTLFSFKSDHYAYFYCKMY